jgi:type IV pilus assembly protein PilZ|uniref:Type 4 fimbrial biogenesis protein PilZ n=1 Tax=mine drainage metagenome TaxID=410659 RepID=E6QRZ6_9ZZZZ
MMATVQNKVRAGVLSLTIKDKSTLASGYMHFITGGGLFLPTTKPYYLGDEVFMILSLLDDPNKMPVSGKVVWITSVGCHGGKTPGIGVQFDDNENGIAARIKIEELLRGTSKTAQVSQTV